MITSAFVRRNNDEVVQYCKFVETPQTVDYNGLRLQGYAAVRYN